MIAHHPSTHLSPLLCDCTNFNAEMSRNLRPLLSGLIFLDDRGSVIGPFLRRDGCAPTQIRGLLHKIIAQPEALTAEGKGGIFYSWRTCSFKIIFSTMSNATNSTSIKLWYVLNCFYLFTLRLFFIHFLIKNIRVNIQNIWRSTFNR